MSEALSITRKMALPGGGEGSFKAVLGVTGGTGHATTDHIAEIVFRKDRYDAMSSGEKAALDLMAMSDVLAAAYAGG